MLSDGSENLTIHRFFIIYIKKIKCLQFHFVLTYSNFFHEDINIFNLFLKTSSGNKTFSFEFLGSQISAHYSYTFK